VPLALQQLVTAPQPGAPDGPSDTHQAELYHNALSYSTIRQ
jgi:hypothetical protein